MFFLHFSKCLINIKDTRRGIEVVITGLTRNQFASNRTWVRIPSSPPKIPRTLSPWNFYLSCNKENCTFAKSKSAILPFNYLLIKIFKVKLSLQITQKQSVLAAFVFLLIQTHLQKLFHPTIVVHFPNIHHNHNPNVVL